MKIAMFESAEGAQGQGGNWFVRARRFLIEVRAELSRVTWPTRREVWATTIVVILTSMVFGLYLYGIDLALSRLVGWVIDRFGG
jgi:preprotein translocase subunit SecE